MKNTLLALILTIGFCSLGYADSHDINVNNPTSSTPTVGNPTTPPVATTVPPKTVHPTPHHKHDNEHPNQ